MKCTSFGFATLVSVMIIVALVSYQLSYLYSVQPLIIVRMGESVGTSWMAAAVLQQTNANDNGKPKITKKVVTVFYHVYIPPDDDDEGRRHALRIVREQIGQIRSSYAAAYMQNLSSAGGGGNMRIVYNTVGGRLNQTDMQRDICEATAYDINHTLPFANVSCELGEHYDAAFEERTLQQLYEYCREDENEDATVVYMHSKGSYHRFSGENDNWRPHLTQAVTCQKCLDALLNDACNSCGLQFWPVWNTFFPGNFFMAKCDYVRRLIPPTNFSRVITDITNRAMEMKKEHLFGTKLYDVTVPGILMVDRYSAEAWVASHPAVVPCDLSQNETHKYWPYFREGYENDERDLFTWSLAPRHDLANDSSSDWYNFDAMQWGRMAGVEHVRLREFFLLPGKMFQWQQMYHEVPPNNSWVWTWYPDGETWKRAAADHGDDAVRVVTQKAKEMQKKARRSGS